MTAFPLHPEKPFEIQPLACGAVGRAEPDLCENLPTNQAGRI